MKTISPLLILALGIIFSLTGCGGGGGGGSPTPETNFAPASINGRTLVFQDPDITGVSTTYTFTAANYTTTGGDSGGYTYTRNEAVRHTATLQIASSFSPVLNYQLTFTSTAGGTFLDTASSKTSTFTIR
ncbi:MAG TPA: hypothetical protein VGD81_05740 [Opitutaceae bacterium]